MSDDNTLSLGQGPFTFTQSQPSAFLITGADEFKLRINADGTIDIGPGLKPDEAGRQAIDAMRHQLQWIIAAARSAALEEAARIADNGMLVPPDGGSPTQDEIDVAERIAAAIRELKDK